MMKNEPIAHGIDAHNAAGWHFQVFFAIASKMMT
jgi:hypothetical protein